MNVGDALAAALRRPQPPETVAGLVAAAGGRPAVARALVGLPAAGALPVKGTARRRAYDTQMRSVQRWTTTAAERRGGPSGAQLARIRRLVAPRIGALSRADLLEAGARVRVHADEVAIAGYYDPRDVRSRTMPAGGPGQYLAPDQLGFLRALEAGDRLLAGELFTGAFGEAYGVDLDFLEVEEIKIWVDGTDEP